jgi:hypothetical protein
VYIFGLDEWRPKICRIFLLSPLCNKRTTPSITTTAGLTSELIDTLSIISAHMPNQRNMVQIRLLEETCKVLGGHSKPPLSEPDYLYSWAKVGERCVTSANASGGCYSTYPNSNYHNNSNMSFAQQLAVHRHSPGAINTFNAALNNGNTATSGPPTDKKRPLSLRGSSLAPSAHSSSNLSSSSTSAASLAAPPQGTPPKSTGFMVSIFIWL